MYTNFMNMIVTYYFSTFYFPFQGLYILFVVSKWNYASWNNFLADLPKQKVILIVIDYNNNWLFK